MELKQRIRTFVEANFFVDGFGDEDSFLGTGIVDSLGMAQLVSFLEAEYGIEIRDEELVPQNLDSVARAAAFVEAKRRHRAAA